MRPSIAVVGSNSFIGLNFIINFKDKYDINIYGKSAIEGFKYTHFYLPEYDLDLENLFRSDIILVFASAAVQSYKKVDRDLVFQVNYDIPSRLMKYLSKNNYSGKLITFGTYFEIGQNSEEKSFTEDDIVQRQKTIGNAYVDSKSKLTKLIYDSKFDLKHYHLILPNVYGKGEDQRNLISFLNDCRHRNESPTLSNLNKTREFLHIEDLLILLEEIIDRTIPSGIYNVSSMDRVKLEELARFFFDKNQIRVGENKRDDGMYYLSLNSQKLHDIVEWRPKKRLEKYCIEL